MSPATITHVAPTAAELGRLYTLCSRSEWENVIMRSQRCIEAACRSLVDFEREASRLLGRRISLDKPSLTNAGDEQL